MVCSNTTVLFSCNVLWSALNLGSSRRIDFRITSKRPGACFSENSFISPGSYNESEFWTW